MSATIKLPELPLDEQILTASDVATGWIYIRPARDGSHRYRMPSLCRWWCGHSGSEWQVVLPNRRCGHGLVSSGDILAELSALPTDITNALIVSGGIRTRSGPPPVILGTGADEFFYPMGTWL